jgi:hypothetical protein
MEHVDSFEIDDGMGNVQRVIRKRLVSQSADDPSPHPSASSAYPPPPLSLSQDPTQVTQPIESTPLPELTSSGAGRALSSVF